MDGPGNRGVTLPIVALPIAGYTVDDLGGL
jgi:hypothetical protein